MAKRRQANVPVGAELYYWGWGMESSLQQTLKSILRPIAHFLVLEMFLCLHQLSTRDQIDHSWLKCLGLVLWNEGMKALGILGRTSLDQT